MDLALDTTGDLALVDDDLALVEDLPSLAQRIKVALGVLLGEWLLDVTAGVDWIGSVLVRDPDLVAVEAILRARIVEVPGVDRIVSLDLDLDLERRLVVRFRVAATRGDAVEATFTLDGDGDVLAVLAED